MFSWLGDVKLVYFSVLMVSVWHSLGFYLVVYIAGLQTVPRDLIEAAMIDGASAVGRFFRVTLPLIMPSITVSVFHSLYSALPTVGQGIRRPLLPWIFTEQHL